MSIPGRLTAEGFRLAVEKIEAHWPTRSGKWASPDAVYPTLAAFGDDVVADAVRQLIGEADPHQPGPVDLARACRDQARRRAERRDPGMASHPHGRHVWGIRPPVLADPLDLERTLDCVLCGAIKILPAAQAPTLGERRSADAAASGVFG